VEVGEKLEKLRKNRDKPGKSQAAGSLAAAWDGPYEIVDNCL